MPLTYSYTTNHSLQAMLDLVQVQVSGTYNDTATSVTLESSEGAKLATIASLGPMRGMWWDAGNNASPFADPNAESVLVTARAGDVLTVERGFGNTAASTKSVTSGANYVISFGWHAGILADIAGILPYNPMSQRWRAKGDGTSDDTARLQQCLTDAAAEGRGIFIPPFTFSVDQLAVPANLPYIFGVYGKSILKQRTIDNNTLDIDRTSGILIESLKFQGIAGNDAPSNNNAIEFRSNAGTPAIDDNKSIVLRDLWFKNARWNGVHGSYCKGLDVARCFFDGCSDGLIVYYVEECTIEGGRWNASQTPENSARQVATCSINTAVATPTLHNKNITIAGIKVYGRLNTVEAILVHDGEHVVIKKVELIDVLMGISAAPIGGGTQLVTDVVIDGNLVKLCESTLAPHVVNYCIQATGNTGGGTKLVGLVVSNNTMINGNVPKNQSNQGACNIHSAKGVTYTGNVHEKAKGAGLVLSETIEDFTHVGNTYRDIQSGASGRKCVHITSSCTIDGICDGNTFADASEGVHSDGNAAALMMGHNRYTNITTPTSLGGGASLGRQFRVHAAAVVADTSEPGPSATHKMAVVDENGATIGYIAIYADF